MDSYVAALEAKLAEVSGIKINQMANAKAEGAAIQEATQYIQSISIQKAGEASAAVRNPLISSVLGTIQAETGEVGKFALPKMGYEYNQLEPTICEEIMRIHHSKHHNGYVTNLNNAVTKLQEAEKAGDVNAINQLTEAINFNGGGHLNHTIFWTNMAPSGGGQPQGELADQINTDFGSFDAFKKEMTAKSAAVKGSGWGWLGWNKVGKKLQVATCQNQDPLEATTGLVPLLGIDVWEHAYYIQYKNLRASYVDKIFDVFNWNNVAERFAKAKK
jgi:Fe-Mn family superoxide dismutase